MVRNIVLTGLTIALLTGCSSKKEENQKTETADAIPVKVMKLEKRNIAKTLDYTATLQADEQVYYAYFSPTQDCQFRRHRQAELVRFM